MFAAALSGQRFYPADPGDPADRSADPADDPLHDAEIVEDRDKAREEDDHRQSGDREGVGEGVARARAEQEFGALVRIAEQVRDTGRKGMDPRAAPAGPKHEPRNRRLQRERRADDTQADRLAIGRQQECDGQDRRDPGDAHQILIH